MYRTVGLGKTVFKIVTGSSGEIQVSAEVGGIADIQAMKI